LHHVGPPVIDGADEPACEVARASRAVLLFAARFAPGDRNGDSVAEIHSPREAWPSAPARGWRGLSPGENPAT